MERKKNQWIEKGMKKKRKRKTSKKLIDSISTVHSMGSTGYTHSHTRGHGETQMLFVAEGSAGCTFDSVME